MKATLPCKRGGGHLNPHFLSKGSKFREVSLFKLVDLESDSRFQTPFLSTRCSKPTKKAELRGTMPSGRQNAAEVCSNKASPTTWASSLGGKYGPILGHSLFAIRWILGAQWSLTVEVSLSLKTEGVEWREGKGKAY